MLDTFYQYCMWNAMDCTELTTGTKKCICGPLSKRLTREQHRQPISSLFYHNVLQAWSQDVNTSDCMIWIINKCIVSIIMIMHVLLLHFLPGCDIAFPLGAEVYSTLLDTRGHHRTLVSICCCHWDRCDPGWAVQDLKPTEASTQKPTWLSKKFPAENPTMEQMLVCRELLIPESQIRFFLI